MDRNAENSLRYWFLVFYLQASSISPFIPKKKMWLSPSMFTVLKEIEFLKKQFKELLKTHAYKQFVGEMNVGNFFSPSS